MAVAAILVKNKYTVRQGSERRGTSRSYDYFLEYELNKAQTNAPAGKGTVRDDS